jgi:hypothetical protein
VAYKVYKELERMLKINNINLSTDKILDIAKAVKTIQIKLPVSGKMLTKTMILTQQHKRIAPLFTEEFWLK